MKIKITRDFQCSTAFLHDAAEPNLPRRVEMYDPRRGEVVFGGSHLIGLGTFVWGHDSFSRIYIYTLMMMMMMLTLLLCRCFSISNMDPISQKGEKCKS